jgi:uncharacterized protein YjdB
LVEAFVVTSAFVLPACGEGRVILPYGEDVRVSPGVLRLTVGDSATIRASRYDREGRRTVARFTFTSDRPAVAEVRTINDSIAVVRALSAGESPVTVFSPLGNGTITVPVTVVPR